MTHSIPEPCDLLIEAGFVVPVEPHGVVLSEHAVAVQGSVIVAVLPVAEARRSLLRCFPPPRSSNPEKQRSKLRSTSTPP